MPPTQVTNTVQSTNAPSPLPITWPRRCDEVKPSIHERTAQRQREFDELCRKTVKQFHQLSNTEKLKLIAERRRDFNVKIGASADKLLARYAELDTKMDKAVDQHMAQLQHEHNAIDEVEREIEIMSNLPLSGS